MRRRGERTGMLESADVAGRQAGEEPLAERRRRITEHLGGPERLARLRSRGKPTVRERIAALLDAGSFDEIGMHAHSARCEDAADTPGDGKIGGYGRVDGRRIAVVGDDLTVKSGTSSQNGGRKVERIYDQALRSRVPFVFLGECGGGRIPDILASSDFSRLSALPVYGHRARRIPSIAFITGDSFGGSSFHAALSDVVVQLRGSCMSVTSPRVVEAAAGEIVTPEELGGVEVNGSISGQADIVVDTEEEGIATLRQLLSLLPSSAREMAPRAPVAERDRSTPITRFVSPDRRRGYDMRRVLRLVADDEPLELGAGIGRGILTALGRIGGHAVGIVASQPLHHAGAFGVDGLNKITRLVLLCDSFNLPLVFLQDTPGLMVGPDEEHRRLLFTAMHLQQALVNSTVPKLTVVLRKAYGLAHHLLAGCGMGADLLCAWPGSEFGFMDPEVGANVLHGRELAGLEGEERRARRRLRAEELRRETDVWGPAGAMSIDDVIEPDETREVLRAHLDRLMEGRTAADHDHALAGWPTSW
ncbi:hypothetical protein LWC33_07980 [Pseudonocardia sp. RS11V-5]|uniref:acyl-CoA carboxylase subunit beta n=1 Tax=Pseudonocardia terrae TaxID=2905831 RepID=UPI001E38101D|nr:carboxyl transferase domain-containing protein [Pseudonocardia terrae]MCE3551389.1 hypothetical protein [Pseudonocardia terrae]